MEVNVFLNQNTYTANLPALLFLSILYVLYALYGSNSSVNLKRAAAWEPSPRPLRPLRFNLFIGVKRSTANPTQNSELRTQNLMKIEQVASEAVIINC
jgi:hypothetical protein